MENKILTIARRLQAVSQAGLHYATDSFDVQRYEEIRKLSVELASVLTDEPIEKIENIFTFETGYQTPKVDIRTVVIKEGKILMAQERSDSRWSLPGGYADINYSPSQVAEKEVWEETGLKVKAKGLLAVIDTDKHNFPPLEYHYYKLVILCEFIDGELKGSNETFRAAFFDFDNLPELSLQRNTKEMMELIRNQLDKVTTYTD